MIYERACWSSSDALEGPRVGALGFSSKVADSLAAREEGGQRLHQQALREPPHPNYRQPVTICPWFKPGLGASQRAAL